MTVCIRARQFPCHESQEPSPIFLVYFFKINFNIILPSMPCSSK